MVTLAGAEVVVYAVPQPEELLHASRKRSLGQQQIDQVIYNESSKRDSTFQLTRMQLKSRLTVPADVSLKGILNNPSPHSGTRHLEIVYSLA
jgi:hypothetical protein